VFDGCGESEDVSGAEIVSLALDVEAELSFEDMDGDGAVGVVLLHLGSVLHVDEDDAQVVLLEERFGVEAGLPGFFLLGVGDLLGEIELCAVFDHGAVVVEGGHDAPLFFAANSMLPSVGCRLGREGIAKRIREPAESFIYLWFCSAV